MKVLSKCLSLIAALFILTGSNAQTVDDIINKHIDAIGGKDLLSKAKSLYMEGVSQVMGNDNPSNTTILNGVGFRSESEFNGSKFIQVYTDKGGWIINPMAGGSPEAMPDEQYKSGKNQIYIGGELYNYADRGNTVELTGKENGAYLLKVTSPSKTESTYYVDSSTYYVNKVIKKGMMQGQEVEITITYSDYKKTDFGLVMPFTSEIDFGGNFQIKAIQNKIEFNKDVNPNIFDMPK